MKHKCNVCENLTNSYILEGNNWVYYCADHLKEARQRVLDSGEYTRIFNKDVS